MKKLIPILLIAFTIQLSGCATPEIIKINKEYIQAVKDWRQMAIDAREIMAFEVAVIEYLMGERIKSLPYESYQNLQKAKEVAAKHEVTEDDLAFTAVWKVTVLTPIAIQLIQRFAPDVFQTLKALAIIL